METYMTMGISKVVAKGQIIQQKKLNNFKEKNESGCLLNSTFKLSKWIKDLNVKAKLLDS